MRKFNLETLWNTEEGSCTPGECEMGKKQIEASWMGNFHHFRSNLDPPTSSSPGSSLQSCTFSVSLSSSSCFLQRESLIFLTIYKNLKLQLGPLTGARFILTEHLTAALRKRQYDALAVRRWTFQKVTNTLKACFGPRRQVWQAPLTLFTMSACNLCLWPRSAHNRSHKLT